MYYLYLILCEDGSIYTGVTNDVNRRFQEHCEGKGGQYTKKHKPLKLLGYEQFSIKQKALKRERQIKGWRKDKKLNIIRKQQTYVAEEYKNQRL